MKKFCLTNKITLLLLILNFHVFCQSTRQDEASYFKWFDTTIYAKNSDLINGTYHLEKYDSQEGFDQYYVTPNFLQGNMVYDQQPYFKVNLSYDLYSDDLILGFQENDLLLPIKLVKDKVESFFINNRSFVHLKDEDSSTNGFFELLLRTNEIILYKKHFKKMHRYLNDQKAYYKFTKKTRYLVSYRNRLEDVDTRKSVSKLFPEKKSLINDFFSENDYLRNTNEDAFFKLLFKQITKE